MNSPTSRASADVVKQTLRVRRFFMAVATYLACGMLAQICAWLGYFPPVFPTQWLIGTLLINCVFYAIFLTGLNLRLGDPSMTEIQLVTSMFAVMALVYHADEARGAFLMLFPLPLLFGALRLRLFELLRVSAVAIAGFVVVIGVLSVRRPEQVKPGLELVNLLALTGVMVFVAVLSAYISGVRVKLSESLVHIGDMAQKDPLTGVFNRRHLNETLALELLRHERGARRGMTLCMVDIDHFKQINDSFGHPAGDEVLKEVAKALGQSIRSNDYLARYGGEEFSLLLDMAPTDDWLTVCDRALLSVSKLEIPAIESRHVAVSIGVAHCVPGDSVSALLSRADKALYRAKGEGRNCIRMAASAPSSSPL